MTQQPLISICTATYSRPKEIQELVHSIVSQFDDKLKDIIEIVISQDPGAANEQEVQKTMEGLVKKRPNIRYFKNEKNLRFTNAIVTWERGTGKYLLKLSDDDVLTPFALSYLVDIIEKTDFDFLLSKPFFTPDIDTPVKQTPNTFTVYHGIKDFINGLYEKEKEYQYLVSYFSFNSIIVVKASYWKESNLLLDRNIVAANEFPQSYPPFYNLKDKTIVFADATLTKGRIVNASYSGTTKLITDFKAMINYIEKQNELAELPAWKAIKKIIVGGWTRTMYLWILANKLGLDYKKKWLTRWLYFFYKKYLQR